MSTSAKLITRVRSTQAPPPDGRTRTRRRPAQGWTEKTTFGLALLQLASWAGRYVKSTRATPSHAAVASAISETARALSAPNASLTQYVRLSC